MATSSESSALPVLLAFLGDRETQRLLAGHISAWYPREACALVFDDSAGLRLELVDNLADRFHGADPESFPRTAETAFIVDARTILRASRSGWRLVAIAHSHPDGSVAFSAEDRRLALTHDGRFPLYPEAFHVVIGVIGAKAQGITGMAVYRWLGEIRDFVRVDAGAVEIVR